MGLNQHKQLKLNKIHKTHMQTHSFGRSKILGPHAKNGCMSAHRIKPKSDPFLILGLFGSDLGLLETPLFIRVLRNQTH